MSILWFLSQSWDSMFNLIHIGVLIVCLLNFIFAFYYNCPHKKGLKKVEVAFIYSPIIFIILLTLWGNILCVDSSTIQTPKWPSYVAIAIYFAQIIWTGYVVYILKGFRWYSISVGILVALYSLGALFIVGMAVTGDWL